MHGRFQSEVWNEFCQGLVLKRICRKAEDYRRLALVKLPFIVELQGFILPAF